MIFFHFFKRRTFNAVCTVLLAYFSLAIVDYGHAVEGFRAALVLSMEIRPYLQAAEGVRSVLSESGNKIDTFLIEDNRDKYLDTIDSQISSFKPDVLIAVGPEAARFIWHRYRDPEMEKFFTMVLDPVEILPPAADACGISLNLPLEDQLTAIVETLPNLKTIGLIFDPKQNESFYLASADLGRKIGVNVLALAVEDRSSIGPVLEKHWPDIQGLWMIPDPTVITESLVRHIIKEALVNGVAVIGYNRYFDESGAAMSFILDYEEIGRQTAELIMDRLAGATCGIQSPRFSVKINEAVLNTLGMVDSVKAAPVDAGKGWLP